METDARTTECVHCNALLIPAVTNSDGTLCDGEYACEMCYDDLCRQDTGRCYRCGAVVRDTALMCWGCAKKRGLHWGWRVDLVLAKAEQTDTPQDEYSV